MIGEDVSGDWRSEKRAAVGARAVCSIVRQEIGRVSGMEGKVKT